MPREVPCREAADILAALIDREVTGDSVRVMVRRGRLPGVRRRGRVFVSVAALEAYAASWPVRQRHSKLRPRVQREWGLRS